MILDVAFPLVVRPHLSVHALLLKVTVEVVGQQLSRGHRLRVLNVIGVELLALVEVLVENGICQYDLVELECRAATPALD
jgi:hypothetical protein